MDQDEFSHENLQMFEDQLLTSVCPEAASVPSKLPPNLVCERASL